MQDVEQIASRARQPIEPGYDQQVVALQPLHDLGQLGPVEGDQATSGGVQMWLVEPIDALLASLRCAPARALVLTQKAVLYLCVDPVQPLFRALGLLLKSRGLRL
jgi:hypothetical protein